MMPHGGIMPSLLSRLGQLIPGFTPRPTPPALVTETPDQRAARRLAELQQQLDRSRARPAPRVDERVPQHYYHGVAGKIWFLPAIDSATQDTPEIRAAMRLMIRDAYVKAAWEPLCIAVESEEWQVQPSESGNALAEEQAEFVTANFTDYLKGGVPALVRAIIGQLGPDGFGLAEKVWDVAERGRLEGKIVLRAAKAKDPTDLHVKGDSYGNVTHVSSTRRQGDEFPITDFLYSRYPGFFDEPLGMSAFRASYAAYWMRDTVRKLRIIHTEKKMAGMLVGTYAEGDDDARATLSTALREAKSSTWMAIPEGCRVEAMQLSTASEPDYKSHDESLRDEIVTGIAFATLQTMTASVPGEGRGDSEVQKETSELAAWRLMSIVLQVVNEQLIPDLIDYNFPFPAAGGYPKLSFGAISKDDILKDQQVIQGAQAMGLTPSKKHYAKAWSVQLADPNDPDDQMQPGGPQMPPGGPGGGFGGGDPFGQPDPFGGGGSLFSEGWSSFAWQPAKSRTGSVKAVGTAEDAGRTLYGRQAEAALARQGRTDRGEPHPELPQEKAKRLAQEREPARAEARQAFARALADPASLTPQQVKELGGRLAELNAEELRGFARNMSMAAGGLKPDLVRRLVTHVRGSEAIESPSGGPPTRGLPAAPEVGRVYNATPAELVVDPKRFQFKLNTSNPAGVTDELKAVGAWNPDFAGTLAVWRDPADGKTYVVNGHHRHELATRLGATDIAVRYLDAKDAKTARAKGALINIAEGRGTAVDAAKFMRDMGVTKEDFAKYGVPLKDGGLADQATVLTRLNGKAFDRLTRGDLDMGKALGVARHVTDPTRQERLFGLLAKREDEGKDISNRTVEEMARAMAAAPTVTKSETTLWGVEETDEDVFVQRAEIAGHVRAELAKEFGDFAALSSQRRAGVTVGAGNVLNIDENKKRAGAAEQAKNLYDQLVNRKGLISDALNGAAVKLANAKTKKERERVRSEATDAVRDAIRGEFAALDARAPANRSGQGGAVPGTGGAPVVPAPPPADAGGAGSGGGGLTGVAAPEAAKPYLDAALANAEGKDGRRLRKELASAHADAHAAGNLSPESDAAFGKAMESLGVKPIGDVGATVPFDPATMESAAGISSGTPVKVTRRGWSGLYGDAATGHENIGNNVRRAMVEPATAPKQPKQPRPAKPKAEAKPTTPAAPKENAVPKAANGLPDVKSGAEQKPSDPAYVAAGRAIMADDRFRKDLADAYNHQMLFIEHRDGLVGLSRLYHELQKRRPDVTLPQFHAAIDQLNRDRGVQLHILNEVHGATDEDRHAAIIRDDRFHNWVRFTGSTSANGRPQADPEKMRPAGNPGNSPKNPPTTVDTAKGIGDTTPVPATSVGGNGGKPMTPETQGYKRNKFPATYKGQQIAAGAGWTRQEDGRWVTYPDAAMPGILAHDARRDRYEASADSAGLIGDPVNHKNNRGDFARMLHTGTVPVDEADAKSRAKTLLIAAVRGGLMPSFAADEMVAAGYPAAVVAGHVRQQANKFAAGQGQEDEHTPERQARLAADAQAWLSRNGG